MTKPKPHTQTRPDNADGRDKTQKTILPDYSENHDSYQYVNETNFETRGK